VAVALLDARVERGDADGEAAGRGVILLVERDPALDRGEPAANVVTIMCLAESPMSRVRGRCSRW
jgi:hypothetical protein